MNRTHTAKQRRYSRTYVWINAQGERFWVKYHFKTDQGIDFLPQEEGDRIAKGVKGS